MIVVALAIVFLGATVVTRIPVDILPLFRTPAVLILAFYPGMPAEIVERDITNRLERWTSQANGIARQESKSLIGVSIVKDYFRPDIDANTAMSQVSLGAIGKLGLSGATGALGLPGFPASPFFRNVAYSANWYQTIFDFGRTKHRVASRKAMAESARLQKEAEADRIVLAVRRAYFSVLEAQRLQKVAEHTVRERRLTLRRVQAYFQAQLRSRLDVNLARANLAEAEGNLVRAQNAVRTAFAALQVAMGIEQPRSYTLQEPGLEMLSLPPLEQLVERGIVSRPDLQALEAKVTALFEQVDVAQSERLPEFRGFGAVGQGRFRGTQVKKKQRHGVGALGLFFPFFTGGRLKAEKQEVRADLEGALALRDRLRQLIRFEVTKSYYQLLDLTERIQIAAEQEQAAQEALLLAQTRFQVQLASFLKLTTAEVVLTRAETNHARALFDHRRARAELEFATSQSVGQ